jgi:hypothetical protein
MEPEALLFEKVRWLTLPGKEELTRLLRKNVERPSTGHSKLEFSYLRAPDLSAEPYLEARGARSAHPYCDRRLIEYMLREVSWDLVHDWQRPYKQLLREAQVGMIPEKVRRREKNEFYFDGFLSRLLHDNQAVLREMLSRPDLPLPIVLSPSALHHALDELSFGVLSSSAGKLLILLSYLFWWRDFRVAKLEPADGPSHG